jgi:hypothetical protein
MPIGLVERTISNITALLPKIAALQQEKKH